MKLSDLFTLYEKEGNTARSWPEERKQVEYIFRSLLAKSVLELRLEDLQHVLDTHPARKNAAWGMRMIRPMLKWSAQRKLVCRELCDMALNVPVGKRERYLIHSEIEAVMTALRNPNVREDIGAGYCDGFQFMLLTMLRREELSSLKWDQIDMRERVIRFDRTKNNRSHVLPLSQQAIALIESRKRICDWVFCYDDGRPLTSWTHANGKLFKVSGTSNWNRHDLRRTGASILGELGIDPHVIEAALNHAQVHTSIHGVYNQSRYRPQVAIALQKLADKFDHICTGQSDNTVVPFPAVA